MVCSHCGCEHASPAQFCRQCGMRFAPPPPMPPYAMYPYPPRVGPHLQPLAILWFIFGAIRIMSGLFGALALHSMIHYRPFMFGDVPPFFPHMFNALVPVIAVTSLVMGGASILVGWSLMTRQPWARTLAIIIGILELLKIPLGTALGIYTLWVLAPARSGEEWQALQPVQR
jgi:hypothetical protein